MALDFVRHKFLFPRVIWVDAIKPTFQKFFPACKDVEEVVEEVMEDVARELFSMKKVMEKGPMKRDVRLPNNAAVT